MERNKLEDWLKDYENKHPVKSFFYGILIKIEMIFINLKTK